FITVRVWFRGIDAGTGTYSIKYFLSPLSLHKFAAMVYNVIGLMSGSSLDGLDIAFVELSEVRGQWGYVIHAAECLPYEARWAEDLKTAVDLSARDYQ